MEKKFIDLWEKNKNKLEDYFRNTEQREYDDYKLIVKKIVELVINDSDIDSKNYDADSITVVDDGSYQGTQIFLIPRDICQPYENDYIFTHNYYGSCSGCDTLQAIHYYKTGKPNEEQIKDYMTLSLHLVQQLRYLIPRENKDGEDK